VVDRRDGDHFILELLLRMERQQRERHKALMGLMKELMATASTAAQDLAAIKTNLKDMTSLVQNVAGDINGLKTTVEGLEQTVSDLQAQVANSVPVTAADLTGLAAQTSKLKDDLSALAASVPDVQAPAATDDPD
jgi:archaellum component FlaC